MASEAKHSKKDPIPSYISDVLKKHDADQPGLPIGGEYDFNLLSELIVFKSLPVSDWIKPGDVDLSNEQDVSVQGNEPTAVPGADGLFREIYSCSTFVYQVGGIGGYDVLDARDILLAFGYDHSGRLDYLVCCRPGGGVCYIVKHDTDHSFRAVYASQGGIGGFDLQETRDKVVAFDYDHSGKLDNLLFYRAGSADGAGPCDIIKNSGGSFSTAFASAHGIGGYDLRDDNDQVIAFDYDHSGCMDHVICYRPGTGTIWILRNAGGSFTPVWKSSGSGIGGYDLRSVNDRIVAIDYDSVGRNDCLLLYRPGDAIFWVVRHVDDGFMATYAGGNGVGEFDLGHSSDRIIGVGNGAGGSGGGAYATIAVYRPGGGNLYLLTRRSGL